MLGSFWSYLRVLKRPYRHSVLSERSRRTDLSYAGVPLSRCVCLGRSERLDINLMLADQLPKRPPVLLCSLSRVANVAAVGDQKSFDIRFLKPRDSVGLGFLERVWISGVIVLWQQNILFTNKFLVTEENRPFNCVFEFADIARPFIMEEFFHSIRAEFYHMPTVTTAILRHKMPCQD